MLWNSVFEFYVKHIFGGVILEGSTWNTYNAYFGRIQQINNVNAYTNGSTANNFANITFGASQDYFMPLGNYLSLIATIITMVIIVTLCALFIWKIIKLVGGLIR